MEDKTFELMSKLYAEMNSRFDKMNSRFDGIDSRFDGIDSRFDVIDKKLDEKADKTDIVRIEDKLDNNSKALFDGYTLTYEKLSDLEKQLENISLKVEKQDIEIRVIKNIAN